MEPNQAAQANPLDTTVLCMALCAIIAQTPPDPRSA